MSHQNLNITLANIITGNLLNLSKIKGRPVSDLILPAKLIEVAKLFADRKISNQGLQTLLEYLVQNPQDQVIETVDKLDLLQLDDQAALSKLAQEIISQNPDKVKEYQEGKVKLIGFFIGQAMQKSQGKCNPQRIKELFEEMLKISQK